jgi:hypothetical protein
MAMGRVINLRTSGVDVIEDGVSVDAVKRVVVGKEAEV